MQSREDLHKLVDSLPEPAIEAANRFLSTLQVWPPRPPKDADKKITMIETRTAAGTKAGFSRWDGETYVVGTYRHVRGHELEIVESIRVQGEHLTVVANRVACGGGDPQLLAALEQPPFVRR